MGYQLDRLTNPGGQRVIASEQLRRRVERLMKTDGPRFRRLWAYYRNPMRNTGVLLGESGSERPYRQAQEWGMPSRITGARSGREVLDAQPIDNIARKEVVIENDIGWRIDTMVIYLRDYGKPRKPPKKPKKSKKQRPKPYRLKPLPDTVPHHTPTSAVRLLTETQLASHPIAKANPPT